MIGGRILDDTVLVGFALGRSVYVLAAGKLACPGCATPLRSAAGDAPPHGGVEPLRAAAASAPTPETRCWAPSRRGTPPLVHAVEAMGQLAAAHARRFVASLPAWQRSAGSSQGSWHTSQRVFNSAYRAELRRRQRAHGPPTPCTPTTRSAHR